MTPQVSPDVLKKMAEKQSEGRSEIQSTSTGNDGKYADRGKCEESPAKGLKLQPSRAETSDTRGDSGFWKTEGVVPMEW